ncbi:hypothetical protein KNT58_gp65 [Mycobacterium phage Fortunato]|uniref:Uncharacterized protein n=1 Tax=Mycobacterium phage Fortunato TaxID=1882439 RepID=A0A1D8EYH3_9CAUD|nr:hypothetical protein KNT58_gp65 [Mycobacterium phage Fortunato]AOT27280.1 hypothetical protein SEA_FORTUNATO_65 [Mycobacterium phage Fortunato]
MDEWPELEALAAAVDRYDEWPEMALIDDVANVIEAARAVVINYRDTKAMVAAYKAMPVDADQARRAMGLPPLGDAEATKACIVLPMPADQGSCACGDPNRPGWYHSRVTGRCYATGLEPEGDRHRDH